MSKITKKQIMTGSGWNQTRKALSGLASAGTFRIS